MKNTKHLIITFFLLFSVLLFSAFLLSDDIRIQKIINHLNKYNQQYPQQKVYLQTDKPGYSVGQTIWIKAYLTHINMLLPDTLSDNLYVELINFEEKVMDARRLKLENGFAKGQYKIPDTLTEGKYKLRAYTNWMLNFDQEFFFQKYIDIANPAPANFIRQNFKDYKVHKRQTKRKKRRLNVHFFPEGGDLISGLESRVAFKAVNDLGQSQEIKGTLYNNKGKRIADFNSVHNGMGSFTFTPEEGKSYFAKVKFPNGKNKKINLPSAKAKGIVVNITNDKQELKLNIANNRPILTDVSENDLLIVAQSGNVIYHTAVINMKEKNYIHPIPKNIFPTGIAQITIFNSDLEPLSERLVFINNNDLTTIKLKTDKQNYGKREKVTLTIKSVDKNGKAVPANLSLAVTDAGQVNHKKYSLNIISQLLLCSDLKGKIEQPGYYFENLQDPERKKHLDLVMLTHGWRRFTWKKVLKNELDKPAFNIQDNITITGQITRDFFKLPLEDITVNLSILEQYNDTYLTVSDEKGKFKFDNLIYFDTITVKIEARRNSGRKNLVIYVDDENIPKPEYNEHNVITDKILATKGRKGEKEVPLYGYKLRKKQEEEGKPEISNIYGEPDYTVDFTEQMTNYNSVWDALKGRVPGLIMVGDKAYMRGINSIYMDTDPLVLVDGVITDLAALRSISPYDVDKVDVLKGSSAAIFGSRGANGVIAVYTKRGRFMKRGEITFQMLGYVKTREFYVPDYENPENIALPAVDNRATIYWNPEIITDKNGSATVEFFTSDSDEKFNITVEGISLNGKPGFTRYRFE